jgi:hypothetical protein
VYTEVCVRPFKEINQWLRLSFTWRNLRTNPIDYKIWRKYILFGYYWCEKACLWHSQKKAIKKLTQLNGKQRSWKDYVFCDVVPCNLIDIDRHFRVLTASIIRAVQATWQNIPVDRHFHALHSENMKFQQALQDLFKITCLQKKRNLLFKWTSCRRNNLFHLKATYWINMLG